MPRPDRAQVIEDQFWVFFVDPKGQQRQRRRPSYWIRESDQGCLAGGQRQQCAVLGWRELAERESGRPRRQDRIVINRRLGGNSPPTLATDLGRRLCRNPNCGN
jgi:hypothetical protein